MRMDSMTQPRGKIPTIQAKPVRSASDNQTIKRPDGIDPQNGSPLTQAPVSSERSGAPVRPAERLYSGW